VDCRLFDPPLLSDAVLGDMCTQSYGASTEHYVLRQVTMDYEIETRVSKRINNVVFIIRCP
jgi:hypothetical protein